MDSSSTTYRQRRSHFLEQCVHTYMQFLERLKSQSLGAKASSKQGTKGLMPGFMNSG